MGPISIWNMAKDYVIDHGLEEDVIHYMRNIPRPHEVQDHDFLAEASWCVFNAGMKESLIRLKWPALSSTFMFFDAEKVVQLKQDVFEMALHIINHKGKVGAVIEIAEIVLRDRPMGKKLDSMTPEDALNYFRSFPYIGDVTKYHLARNCGYEFCKPDRHLVRLAQRLDSTPDKIVNDIAACTGERIGFVDFILWRWLAWGGTI